MHRALTRLGTLALLLAVPLTLCTTVEDVFFGAWRAAEWAFLSPLLFLAGLRWLKGSAAPRLDAATWPWALLAAWALAGSRWSVNPADGWRRALELSGTIAAFWLGREAAARPRRMLLGAVAAAVLCSAYGVLQYLGIEPLPWSTRFGERAFGTLGNPDYYAGHLLPVFPLLVWLASTALPLAASLPGAVVLAAGFLFSQVRGAWLAALGTLGWAGAWIAVGTGGLAPRQRTVLRQLGLAAGILLLGVAAASPDFRDRFSSVVAVGGYDATGRRFLWTVAARIWRDRPLVGFGTGSFKYEFPRHQIVGLEFPQPQFHGYNYSEHAHFELLQLGAELGLVGVALFLAGILAWLLRWARALRAQQAAGDHGEWWLQLMLGTSLAAGVGYSVVNFPFQIVPTALLWWAVLGLSLGRLERTGPSRPGWTFPRPLAALAGAGVLGLAAAGAVTTAADLVGSGYLHGVHGMIEMKNHRAARYYYALGMRMTPFDYRLPKWVARIAAVEGDTDLAEQMLAVRQRLHPRLADALDDRAQAYMQAGRKEDALRLFQELVAVAPNYVSAWGTYLGPLYFERKDYPRAVDAFRQAVRYQDGNAQSWHNLASALGTLKRFPEALAADEAAIQRDPSVAEYYIGATLSARALKQRDLALRFIQRGNAVAPGDPRLARLLQQLQR